jgi:lysophospholipase L1-like esterase
MIEQAVERKPTTTLVWIGNNDALGPALFNNKDLLTGVADFEADFRRLMSELEKTGTDLVVGTIPDVTLIPYFESAKEIAAQYSLSPKELNARIRLDPGDYVRRSALPIIDSILKTGTPSELPEMCPPPIYLFPSLPCRLSAADAKMLQERTKDFNKIIEKETHKRGGVLVDTNKLVEEIAKNGYRVGNQRLTTDYLGGLFSLDGIHPSHTGYAVIANYFIEQMNRHLKLQIPSVPVETVWALDPLKDHVQVTGKK